MTATGITAPSFTDLINSLVASYQIVYGSDVVLDASTQDYQWIAIQAAAINDSNQTAIAIYNSFSPGTAQGVALDSVVKVNGLQRLVPSNSTADLVIVGQAGTTITNGVVGDNAGLGTRWDLPGTVDIPTGGSITVTATSETAGAVAGAANSLTKILTPTAGWQSSNNPVTAAVGAPVETDAALRRRQSFSTANPSRTVLNGIEGALLNLPGVTAVFGDDNDTGSTDANGVPAHTLGMVVEGGSLQDIVDVIGRKKTIGGGTYGNTSGVYVDPDYGFTYTINFSVPVQKTILVQVTKTALTGYTTAIGVQIQRSVAAYVSSLGIGQDVILTRIYAPALLRGPYAVVVNPTDPDTFEITSILISISPASVGSSDLTIGFAEIAVCLPANVTIV